MISIKKINNFLIYIILFFTIFGSAYNYTYFPQFLSYLKDFSIFVLFFQVLIKKKFLFPKDLGWSFVALFIIIAFFSWTGFMNCTEYSKIDVFIVLMKYLEFFISIIVFCNINMISTIDNKKIVKIYIIMSIVLIFVHLFGYFIPNNIVSPKIMTHFTHGYYNNRISIGQPAISVFPMIMSIIYLMVYSEKNIKKVLFIVFLTIGVVISVATTGIISLLICFVCLFFFLKKKEIFTFIKHILPICLLFFLCIPFLISKISINNLYETQIKMFTIKIEALFNDRINDYSMIARDIKYSKTIESVDNVIDNIFGLGVYGYNRNGIDIGNMENTFRLFRVSYGIIGVIIFSFFIFSNLIKNFYKYLFAKNKKLDYLFLFLLFLVYILHSWTLDIIYPATIVFSFSIFYSVTKNNENGSEKNENINC